MSVLKFVTLAFMVVVLTGCQALDAPDSAVSTPASSQASSQIDPLEKPGPSPRESVGQLAYIGGDGNVYLTTAGRETPIAVTDDATTFAEGTGLSYHRISWSPDGQLAFAAVDRSVNSIHSKLYVMESPDEPAHLVGQSDEHFVIYIYWSPVSCPARPACHRLAYLIEEEDGIALRLVELEASQVKNRRVGVGRPFYFSWASDGRQLLWHTGGAHRYNNDARLALYHIDHDLTQTLPQSPGLFLAPAWSPQGERWLGVAADEKSNQLQSFGPDRPVTLATAANDHMAFAWSPQGDRVAYAVQAMNSESFFYGPIHIFDLNTGQTKRITGSFPILAFFWAPGGDRLGYLTQVSLGDAWMQWRVYNLTGNEDRGFAMFRPSFHMSFMAGSFNQYAQSHRFWSPDGRYLVYADRDPGFVERVWLVDTWAERGARPILVDEGTIGVWSWN